MPLRLDHAGRSIRAVLDRYVSAARSQLLHRALQRQLLHVRDERASELAEPCRNRFVEPAHEMGFHITRWLVWWAATPAVVAAA